MAKLLGLRLVRAHLSGDFDEKDVVQLGLISREASILENNLFFSTGLIM